MSDNTETQLSYLLSHQDVIEATLVIGQSLEQVTGDLLAQAPNYPAGHIYRLIARAIDCYVPGVSQHVSTGHSQEVHV